jgi:hypothetical protein
MVLPKSATKHRDNGLAVGHIFIYSFHQSVTSYVVGPTFYQTTAAYVLPLGRQTKLHARIKIDKNVGCKCFGIDVLSLVCRIFWPEW